jgi:7-cyano-7-deazaguanine tRNA-ribosyltransferase
MSFEIKYRDAAGRICRYVTKHGAVTTPNLLPVINPNKLLIPPKEMKKLFGTEILITNSYIINKDEKLKKKALDEGLHNLLNFNGPIMTDSGTFQSYIYNDIDVDPIEIVEFQRDIGSDIGTILDVFGKPDQTKTQAKNGVKETISRAKKSVRIKKDMALACTVQGSIYPDLRKSCAQELSKIGSDFFPIGGVVPLMENQDYSTLIKIIISSKKGLDPSKPVHLFGAGHPLIFPIAVALGCDFFDSAAYAKYAQDKRLLFPWGTEKLEDITELFCSCPICSNYTIAELKKLEEKQMIREIAKHNLYISFAEIKKIRNSIRNGSLWELVERRANSNPYLLKALSELSQEKNKIWLEQYEPISKNKALFYTGNHTIHRPLIYRSHNRLLDRYKSLYKIAVVFPEGNKPYSRFYSNQINEILKKIKKINILINSNIGPIPIELDETYPFAQSIFPEKTDDETEKYLKKIFKKYTKGKNLINWKGKKTLDKLGSDKSKKDNLDRLRISAISDFQFGRGAGKALLNGEFEVIKSKKTGKIRNILLDKKHILSMRASDGMFSLKLEGGKILHKHFKSPNLRVIVEDDAIPFIKDGKSVFAKFVKDCDPDLRPYDECLIVSEKDTLLATGRCILNRLEMLSFEYGVAVKTKNHTQ